MSYLSRDERDAMLGRMHRPSDYPAKVAHVSQDLPLGAGTLEARTAARRLLVAHNVIPYERRGHFYGYTRHFGHREPEDDLLTYTREMVVRELHKTLTREGYSTTLTLISAHWEEMRDDIYGDITYRWQFPRPRPDVGDPARVDGGPCHGTRFTAAEPVEETHLTPDPATPPALRTPTPHHLAGFDVSTGEWVYYRTS